MKICILSNSHAHMLKHAMDARSRSWSFQIFAAPATGLRGLRRLSRRRGLYSTRPSLNRWLAKTSGGQTQIHYADYDGFAVVGLGLRCHTALRLFGKCQPHRQHLGGPASLISEQAFRDVVRERLTRTTGYRLMRMLSAQARPVVVVPAPMPNENIANRAGYGWLKTEGGGAGATWVRQIVEEEIIRLAEPFGYTVARQPPQTIGVSGLSRPEYARGAVRVGGKPYADHDVSHMGAEYGQVVLDQIEAALKTSLPSTPKRPATRAIRVIRKRWRQLTAVLRKAFRPDAVKDARR